MMRSLFYPLFLVNLLNTSGVLQAEAEQVQKEKCDTLTGKCPLHRMYDIKQNKVVVEEIGKETEQIKSQQLNEKTHYGGPDENYNPEKLENSIPTAQVNRKKLKMLGAAGYYIRDFLGDVYEYVTNDEWEGVWVHLSLVRIRVYGEIGEGRWRFAFSGKILESESKRFPVGMNIVVKSVNEDVLKEQKEEVAVKRALQTQILARKITYIASKNADPQFGQFPEIINVWMFKGKGSTWMIEEKLEGSFQKLINNDMTYLNVPEDLAEDQNKAIALAHFSYEFTEQEALITDLQGVGLRWTDVEIATMTINAERYFGIGNLGRKPHKRFIDEHKCNKFCKFLRLPNLIPRCIREEEHEREGRKKPAPEDSASSDYNERKMKANRNDPLKNA